MAIDRVTPEEAKEKLDSGEGWTYIDVRTVQEFEGGHAPGAKNIPVMERGPMGMAPNAEFVSVVEKNFDKDAKIITACLRGGRSMKAAQMLQAAGFTNVIDMRGGFDGELDPSTGQIGFKGWAPRGLPVTAESAEDETYSGLR